MQLVTDEHHRQLIGDQVSQSLKQTIHLLGYQHGGWFVQDQHAGVVEQRFENLDPLSLADREVLHEGGGLDGHPEPFRSSGNSLVGFVHIEADPPGVAENDVLGDGQRRYEREVLGDHSDAGSYGVARRADPGLLTADQNAPRIRLVETVQDPHEGRLACTVLSEQGVDFALLECEVDSLVGGERPEALVDVLHPDRRRGGLCGHVSLGARTNGAGPIPLLRRSGRLGLGDIHPEEPAEYLLLLCLN